MTNSKDEIHETIVDIKANFGTGRDYINTAIKNLYQLQHQIMNSDKQKRHLSLLYDEAGLKTQKSTDVATKLVRLAITSDRKKANPYAKVLRQATQAKVTPDGFLDWLNKHGGIERIRLSKHPLPIEGDAKSEKEYDQIKEAEKQAATKKIDKGMNYIASMPSKTILKNDSNLEFKGNVALLVVFRRTEGLDEDLTVVEVLDEKTAEAKSVFRRHAKDAKLAEASKKQQHNTH
ncbi:MAG: hypothetical protein COB78_12695 [Hyphomicrobiales bacterium]|nr:MAG: hypothetical protein COB78_12695 [Hyphomicrobiales bacterium]